MAQEKRPPAHEVILRRFQEIEREILRPDRVATRNISSGFEVEQEMAQRHRICGELLDVLDRMHLPEQEGPKILAALRELDTDLIGIHRARTQLLERLSGHSPAHAAGT